MNNEFSAPYFTTLMQFVSPIIVLQLLSLLNACIFKTSWLPRLGWALSPVLIRSFSIHTAVKLLPISFLFCATVTLSNLCLKYVEVSFYQISRSLGIPIIPFIK